MSLCRIVVAGEALVDVVAPRDGGPAAEHLGGGPFTTARALARLGAGVCFLGALSGDDRGRRLRAALADDGVDVSLAVATDLPTTTARVSQDAHGGATYEFDVEGTSAPDVADAALPDDVWALHVGSLGLLLEPLATTLARLLATKPRRSLVMVDPNVRPAFADRARYLDVLFRTLKHADVLKCSRDDLDWLFEGRDALEVAATIARSGPSVVLVTDGPRGVWVVGPDAPPVHLDAPAVEVVDSIGAGDAFSGGWLAWWARAGHTRAELDDADALAAASRFACRVAAKACERPGADPPHAAEVGWVGRMEG